MVSNMVASDCFIKERTLLNRVFLCFAASLVLSASAWISVPMYPVPMSLQSLAVILVGAVLGSRLGALAVCMYLFEGAIGFPVFSGGTGGIAALFSTTFGYKIGFIASAYVAGLAAERGKDRKFISALPWLALAHQLIFFGGVLWLTALIGFKQAFISGYVVFAGLDVIKFTLGALLLVAFWKRRA